MSVGPADFGPSLHGLEGDLVSVRISVEPRLIERLLDALAQLDFPVNPQLYHSTRLSTVEFPAWAGRIPTIREALRVSALDAASLTMTNMLEALRAIA